MFFIGESNISSDGSGTPCSLASKWTAKAKQHLNNVFLPPLPRVENEVTANAPVFLPKTSGRYEGGRMATTSSSKKPGILALSRHSKKSCSRRFKLVVSRSAFSR